MLTAVSPVDGRERRIAWRRIDPYPLFVMAGLETSAIRAEWLGTLATHLVFGVPATMLMLGALWVALVRTRALFDEAARRAAAEEALQRAQRLEALGELTGGVAHDFNNLLMIVLGNVDRMRRRPREAGDIRALDMIVAAVRRGEALTRQLLSFARRRALFPEPIDLARQLADMRSLLSHSLRGDITVDIDTGSPPETYVVKVDPAEFELAVLNVAVNARDAMPQGGKLTLRLRRVTLTVEQDIDDLLGDFVALSLAEPAPASRRRAAAGVRPVLHHQGSRQGHRARAVAAVWLRPPVGRHRHHRQPPGAGTIVTLYLPVTDRDAAAAAASRPPSAALGDGLRASADGRQRGGRGGHAEPAGTAGFRRRVGRLGCGRRCRCWSSRALPWWSPIST